MLLLPGVPQHPSMHSSPSLPPWLSSTFALLSPTPSCVPLCFSFYFPDFFFIHLSDVTQDKSPHMQKHKITLASFHLQILWVRNSGSTRGGRTLPHHVEAGLRHGYIYQPFTHVFWAASSQHGGARECGLRGPVLLLTWQGTSCLRSNIALLLPSIDCNEPQTQSIHREEPWAPSLSEVLKEHVGQEMV